jgi:hypothetical protein
MPQPFSRSLFDPLRRRQRAEAGCAGGKSCHADRRMRWHLAFLMLMLPVRAGADPAPVALHLTYDGYASGFRVFRLESDLLLGPGGYRIAMTGHTSGMFGFVYHARWHTLAEGTWTEAGVLPQHFENTGVFGGQPRRVDIDFVNGNPVLRVLQPPDDGEHLPVPPGLAQHAIDTLSIMAMVIRQTGMLGHCGGTTKEFDGRQVELLELRAAGADDLLATSRSSWRGPTLRCDIAAHVLGGFFRDNKPELRDHVDSIWMAAVQPGMALLPVRMTAMTYRLGRTVLYLTGVTVRNPGTLTARQP